MIITELGISGAYLVTPDLKYDDRGFFTELYNVNEFNFYKPDLVFKQYNLTYCRYEATLRGLHYQVAPFANAKFVRCESGSAFDVFIDLRKNSPTYKKYISVYLSGKLQNMVYIPEECAHGYLSLEKETRVCYLLSDVYNAQSECGIRFDDPAFNIKWPVKPVIISEKDKTHPNFKD